MDVEGLPDLIATDRLQLRPWRLGDVDDVLAYAQDPEWSRFLRALPRPYGREDAEAFIARQILLDRALHAAWAVELDGSVVGGIGLRFQPEHRRAELGYSLARRHWNRGYVTEAAGAVVDAAFRTCPGLNRIHARADVENRASQRVMEKIGMAREGVLRQNRFEREEFVDEVWFAVLRSDWAS